MTALMSRPHSVRRLSAPEHLQWEASDDERAAIAEAYGLLGVDRLAADFTVRPYGGDGVLVSGTVDGAVTQACVVSLEPVPGTVCERVERRFSPDAAADDLEVAVDPDQPDPPERLERDTVDLGAIALEHFLLGLPDYPRAPDAAFEPPDPGEEEPSPFAVLAALKNKTS